MPTRTIRYFPFLNEIDVLHFHLCEIYDSVDHIIVSESDFSHNGRPKGYLLEPYLQSRFSGFAEKLIYVKTRLSPNLSFIDDALARGAAHTLGDLELNVWKELSWRRDRVQKARGFSRGVAQIGGLRRDDTVVASDLDEIVSKEALGLLRERVSAEPEVVCGFEFRSERSYFRQFNLHFSQPHQPACCAFSGAALLGVSESVSDELLFRVAAERAFPIENNSLLGGVDRVIHRDAGWHLSYFWDTETMRDGTEKIRAFADSTTSRRQVDSCFRERAYYHRGVPTRRERRIYGRRDLEAETKESGIDRCDTTSDQFKIWCDDPLPLLPSSFQKVPTFRQFLWPPQGGDPSAPLD